MSVPIAHKNKKSTQEEMESFRCMAPEVLNPGVGTTSSDIWSFGMVMYEVLTRKDPYHEYSMFTVITKVASGGIPNRPETIGNDKIWNLMKDCWMLKPTERPTIQDVIQRLDTVSG